MAESYSDEELATGFVGLKEPAGLSMLVTAQRLMRERDEWKRLRDQANDNYARTIDEREQWRRSAEQARAEALEEAIRVAEGTTGDAWDVARRIRALKDLT